MQTKAPTPQKRVMIVEDEGLIANDIAGQLNVGGYSVAGISASGEEALASLREASADLVLMDIRLKGKLDGIETAVKIRQDFHLPVIFLTSHADSDTLSRAKLAEPFGYLVKPFRQLNLCGAIEVALHKHRTDRALAEREAWLSTVLESLSDAAIVTDSTGLIQFLNAAAGRLLGGKAKHFLGSKWTEAACLFEPGNGARLDDLVSLATVGSRVLRIPAGTVLRNCAGAATPVEGEVSPSFSNGTIIGAVVTLRDVSKRMREEAEFRQQQKTQAIGRLAGGLAHEFNNMLQVILGHASILSIAALPASAAESVGAISNAARASAELTRQLLTLSNKRVLASTVLDVTETVARLADSLRAELGPAHKLKLELNPEAGKVKLNASQFERLVTNLALSARNAMPDGGTIAVSTSERDRISGKAGQEKLTSFAVLTVADSGYAISPGDLEELFDPFFSSKTRGRGAGLGLAIADGIAKSAGGDIEVRSDPEAGTFFSVSLPKFEADDQPLIGREWILADPAADPATGRSKTILLVEDQTQIRKLIQFYFEGLDYKVIGAGDGPEALEAATRHLGRLDLLISDVLMPEMNGPELSKLLGAEHPEMKTLFISGHAGDSVEELRRENSSSGFLQKPFALTELLEKVEELTA